MARTANKEGIQYGSPQRGKQSPARQSANRRCEHPECSTVLSTYNASTTCWMHTGPEFRHALAKS